jgi:polyisoprenyl-teichoic acid--peptidoglycan teichoic acid transferase
VTDAATSSTRPRVSRKKALVRIGAGFLAVAVLSALVLVAAGAAGKSGPALALADVVEIHSAHGASFVPALEGKRPLFILALGSDARPGQNIERERADSIHLIGVDLQHDRATILGFPRDSWVPIPGHGTTKINTAMVLGGPNLMVKTVESITGIRVDFWMLTSFNGLIRMVNGIGGLSVNVPRPMHDRFSGANFSKGRHTFKGSAALAFARDRHDVPGGDLGRSANQGRLLLAALSKLNNVFGQDPGNLLKWISIGWRNIRTDLGLPTLLKLGLTATRIDPNKVTNLVVPSTTGNVGAVSVVFISARARSLFADLRADGFAS